MLKTGFTLKRIDVIPFHTAVLSGLLPVSGMVLILKTVWPIPGTHTWAIAGSVLLLFLVAFQMQRIHRVYQAAAPSSQANEVVKKLINETIRTFIWGNALFVIVCLILFQLHLSHL